MSQNVDERVLTSGFGERLDEPPQATVSPTRQVHASDVVCADNLCAGPSAGDCDALIATKAGVVVAVRTADCVPILMYARRNASSDEREGPVSLVAAVHAGWRGTLAGIVGQVVSRATSLGVEASSMKALLGPSIGKCCYEVSYQLAERFHAAGLLGLSGPAGFTGLAGLDGSADDVGPTAAERPHIDLRSANEILLLRAGLDPSNISRVGPCTCCRHQDYHSYRNDSQDPGRQWSWIGISK